VRVSSSWGESPSQWAEEDSNAFENANQRARSGLKSLPSIPKIPNPESPIFVNHPSPEGEEDVMAFELANTVAADVADNHGDSS
jgi:hypothetical protein